MMIFLVNAIYLYKQLIVEKMQFCFNVEIIWPF